MRIPPNPDCYSAFLQRYPNQPHHDAFVSYTPVSPLFCFFDIEICDQIPLLAISKYSASPTHYHQQDFRFLSLILLPGKQQPRHMYVRYAPFLAPFYSLKRISGNSGTCIPPLTPFPLNLPSPGTSGGAKGLGPPGPCPSKLESGLPLKRAGSVTAATLDGAGALVPGAQVSQSVSK